MDEREESTDLKVVFLITLLIAGLELFAMFNKHHFFTLLGTLLLVSSFVLGYFEKKYVQVLLAWFAISVVLDALWLGLSADVTPPSHRSTGSPAPAQPSPPSSPCT